MTVKELIDKLNKFCPELTVLVTDGFNGMCYRGEYLVVEFVDDSGAKCVDIGVGGTEE